MADSMWYGVSLLTEDDLYLFNQGTHFACMKNGGLHPCSAKGRTEPICGLGPDAERASVVGDFNGWDPSGHLSDPGDKSGIWEGFIPGHQGGCPTSSTSSPVITDTGGQDRPLFPFQ